MATSQLYVQMYARHKKKVPQKKYHGKGPTMPGVMRRHTDIIDLSEELQNATAILTRESFAVCSTAKASEPSAVKRRKVSAKSSTQKVPDVEVIGVIQRNAITGQPVAVVCQNPGSFDISGQQWKPYVFPELTVVVSPQFGSYVSRYVMPDQYEKHGPDAPAVTEGTDSFVGGG